MKRLLTAALVLLASTASAGQERKQSTTAYPTCFLLIDSADHVTPEAGHTISGSDCQRSKNGGSFSDCSGAVTDVGSGVYCLAGHATDRDTVGSLVVKITDSGADQRTFEVSITAADPFAYPDTSSTLAAVTTVTTTTTATTCTNLTNAPTAGDFTSTMKTSLNNSTPACSSVSGAVGSVTGNVGGNVVGTVASVVGNVGGNVAGSVASVSGAVGSVTGNVGGNVTGSVGSVTAAVTVGTINTDVVNANALAANAVAEIQSGLATSSDVSTAQADITAIKAKTDNLPSDPADASDIAALFALVPGNVWSNGARTLTGCSFCITAADVWGYSPRTLTSGGGVTAADVWMYAARTLTTISGPTNIIGPTPTAGTMVLTRNDSYYLADGAIPTFTRTTWPDIENATEIRLTVRRRPSTGAGADPILFSVTDRTASRIGGDGEQTVAFELSEEDTADLVPGANTAKYDIQATLESGHEKTLETGIVTVIEDQTRPE